MYKETNNHRKVVEKMAYPENVPALLTLSEFAKRCGVSRATASKIVEAHPEYIEQIDGGQKYVKASLLFSFYDSSGQFVELDERAVTASSAIS